MLTLAVESRKESGTGPIRRLRRLESRVPGVIYGGEEQPALISCANSEIDRLMKDERFYTTVVELELDGKKQQVILKDLQRHPTHPIPLHLDFQRVSAKTVVDMTLPIHYINEDKCEGIRSGGGMLVRQMSEIRLTATITNMPKFIEVDVEFLNTGDTVHLKDITLPTGVIATELAKGVDQLVASVVQRRGAAAGDSDDDGLPTDSEETADDGEASSEE